MITFAKEAWPFVLPFVVLAVALAAMERFVLATSLLLVSILVLAFFRIPRRRFTGSQALLVAPASGRITAIEPIEDARIAPGPMIRVVTFLSVFDVHVQRAPAAGKVVSTAYRRGKKIAAFKPEAGEVNESRTTIFETRDGSRIAVRQLAGLVARRVVGYLDEGDSVERGELMGVIKFGSRVDLFIPADFSVLVRVGQRVQEGLTPIASPGAEIGET